MTATVFPGGTRVAVVEVGSGSTRLLVTDEATLAAGGPDPVRLSQKTQLLRGEVPELDPRGLDATARAFERFADLLTEHRPASIAVVATEVARRVGDADPLHRLSRDLLGQPLQVLSGAREAELGLVGAMAGRDLSGPVSSIDIGAGSTDVATYLPSELSSGSPSELPSSGLGAAAGLPTPGIPTMGMGEAGGRLRGWSLPLGARDLVDRYLLHDPPGPDELSSALSVAELHYDDLHRELPELVPALEHGVLIGVGAIGQIAAVEIGLADPEATVDGYRLTRQASEEVFRALATESAADRLHNPGLRPEDVDVIVGGLCLLVEFLRRFPVGELVVSERNLRHGVAAELAAKG